MDRISNLPDNVINHILQCLTIVEAVKTSALSRSWRYRWTHLWFLKFDTTFTRQVQRFYGGSPLACAYIVSRILAQHTGHILGLTLYISNDNGVPIFSLFERLIRKALSSTSLQILDISVEVGNDLVSVTFPSFIFSAINLRSLKIFGRHFYPPSWFKGFPNLTHFTYGSTSFKAQTISHFISLCPRLEVVRLYNVECDDQDLELEAPKLTYLRLWGLFKDINVSNAPNLESFTLSVLPDQESNNLVGLCKHFDRLANVKKISLNDIVCKILARRGVIQILPRFDHIKELVFTELTLHDEDQLKCILSILDASPNVKKTWVTCNIRFQADNEVQVVVDPLKFERIFENHIHSDFRCLLEVELSIIRGTTVDLKIIELLLRFSPVLKLFRIKFETKITKDAKIQFLNALLNFYRASTIVKFDVW